MTPPHESVPPPPPVTLNVAPLAPVSVSPEQVQPHVPLPVTVLRLTPFVPPVELTCRKLPLIAPGPRFSAVAAEPLTFAPIVKLAKFDVLLMPTVAPLPPVIVTPARLRLVLAPWNETPVVPAPLVIVPPLTVTVPAAARLTTLMPVAAPVVVTLLKVMPEPPTVMALRFRPATAAPVVMFAVPLTLIVPLPVALKPVPVDVVMASVPLKEMIPPLFVVRVTAGFVVVPSVCVPVKLTCAPVTLVGTEIPAPLSVMPARMGVTEVAPRFEKLMVRWPAFDEIVFVLFIVNAAVPPLMVRPNGELLMAVFVMVTVPLGVVSTRPEAAALAPWIVIVSIVRPAVFVPVMQLPVVGLRTLRPLTVLPLARVRMSPVVLVICGFVPAATRVWLLTTSATPSPINCSLLSSLMPAFWFVLFPVPL